MLLLVILWLADFIQWSPVFVHVVTHDRILFLYGDQCFAVCIHNFSFIHSSTDRHLVLSISSPQRLWVSSSLLAHYFIDFGHVLNKCITLSHTIIPFKHFKKNKMHLHTLASTALLWYSQRRCHSVSHAKRARG